MFGLLNTRMDRTPDMKPGPEVYAHAASVLGPQLLRIAAALSAYRTLSTNRKVCSTCVTPLPLTWVTPDPLTSTDDILVQTEGDCGYGRGGGSAGPEGTA